MTDQKDFAAGVADALQAVQRNDFSARTGVSETYGGKRDLFDALGYPSNLTYRDFKDWYERGGVAKTIIEKPAKTTWRERPDLIDDADVGDEKTTDFEDDVESLFDASTETALTRGLRHYFERVDTLGRIGKYSVLFIGLSDVEEASELKKPVDSNALSGLDDLLYLTPLGQADADINTWVTDVSDPRNGLPETYKLDLSNGPRSQTHVVHHSRVIHVAEGILDNEVYGQESLRPVINQLHDLIKVVGSSAEAYWMVSNPGLALNVDPELSDIPTDKMDEQVDEYEHGYRRIMKLFGTDVEQLQSQDVNPEGVVDSIIKIIAGTVEIPQRQLVGSERGELASSQDEASYLNLISSRQTSFDEPVILRSFFDRLIRWGIVSTPRKGTYTVEWPNLFQLTELEEAELLKALSQTVVNLAPMGQVDLLHSPEALRDFSPIEEPDDAVPPDELEEEPVDEDNSDVQRQFDELVGDD